MYVAHLRKSTKGYGSCNITTKLFQKQIFENQFHQGKGSTKILQGNNEDNRWINYIGKPDYKTQKGEFWFWCSCILDIKQC